MTPVATRCAAGGIGSSRRAGVSTPPTTWSTRRLTTTAAIAQEQLGQRLAELSAEERPKLLDLLRARAPAFYKQLRMDVSALYLSDPGVWARIGFPGPSTESGGYPDLDQPPS